MPRILKNQELVATVNAVAKHGSYAAAARHLGLTPATVKARCEAAKRRGLGSNAKSKRDEPKTEPHSPVTIKGSDNEQVITLRTNTVRTLKDALRTAKVDISIWEVKEYVINKWDMVAKKDVDVIGDPAMPTGWRRQLAATELWQVKVWLRRKTPEVRTIETIIDNLRRCAPVVSKIKRQPLTVSARRAYEVCIMDPHMGMHCFPPGSDHAWSLEDCEEICMWALETLIKLSKPFWPIEEIVIPMGNDLFHVDNLHHTTTAMTPQPEADSYYQMYHRGVTLCIAMIERLKQIAPVKIKIIQGNHDRQSAFTLGYVLWAYFHNDENVEIDKSASPYKFYQYGTNLIGYDHGHSVGQVRMAALMANEVPHLWAKTSYREWHCGDQHRKGTSKPTSFEEQGVSVEYLPGLTPPNEWHRLRSYNWQKRGALGYVWDHDAGPIARLQCNINSYTGRPTGEKKHPFMD